MEEQAKKLKEKLEKEYDVKVFTDSVELEALKQIESLVQLPVFADKKIRLMPDCLTEDTEILTSTGFKKIINLKENELISNYNPDTKMVSFLKPVNIINRPLRSGEKVFRFINKKTNTFITTTENHRMALRDNMGDLAKNINKFATKDYIFSSNGVENPSCNIPDDYIRLICWVVGDGFIQTTHNPKTDSVRIRFGLKKDRKINRIEFLLNNLGLDYTKRHETKQTCIDITVKSSKYLISLVGLEKKFPKELLKMSKEQAKLFFEELIQVDGDYESYRNKRGYRINSTDIDTINLISEIASLNGKYSIIRSRGDMKSSKRFLCPNPKELFYINLIDSIELEKIMKSGFSSLLWEREEIDYKGNAVCVETNTGFFIARQNGLTFVTGNCHSGKGATIGFTGNLGDKVISGVTGVDINCGMRLVNLGPIPDPDFHAFHEHIKANVPSGQIARESKWGFKPLVHEEMDIYREAKELVKQLKCMRELKNSGYINASIGTLGGGNHFIELDRGETDGNLYLVIHTGSRNLGKQVADIYQKIAVKNHMGWDKLEEEKKALIEKMKAEGKRAVIQEAIKELHRNFKGKKVNIPEDLCWLEGEYRDNYLHDMKLCGKWAELNRKLISTLLKKFFPGVEPLEEWECVHNYIGEDNIVRKGAISAREGELGLIPLNMRDGSLIVVGKGNPDWNYSAPHGAGRILSRKKAYEQITIKDFRDSMKGIYSETITDFTRDEAPMVYKPAEEIKSLIGDTVDIRETIKPVFNFKADN